MTINTWPRFKFNTLFISILATPMMAYAAPNESGQLDNVIVTATTVEQEKANNVYNQSLSSIYMDRATFERFKGASAGDIFRGQVGVFNGDPRNGALEPNIRGIMGLGKVPVTVDGVEMGITRNKGFYTGTGTASYIDTNLLVSGDILKGPAINRDVKTSSGGGVAFKTIGPRDIIKPGQSFGVLLKTDLNNNTTSPRFPATVAEGIHIDAPWENDSNKIMGELNKQYPNLVDAKTSKDNKFFNGKSGSAMAAVAWRNEQFGLMAAYSYRKQGNYFSGKHGADGYREGSDFKDRNSDIWKIPVARLQLPGNEVTNTSSINSTVLLKGEWNITDNQQLALSSRFTNIKQGGVIGSQIRFLNQFYGQGSLDTARLPQLPEGEVKQQVYNLEYRLNPENPWVDLKAQAWLSKNYHKDYTNRGYVNGVVPNFDEDGKFIDFITMNTLRTEINNDRYGFAISNVFQLHPKLNLLLGGNYQNETLRPEGSYPTAAAKDWPNNRDGRRKEHSIYFNFNWQPYDWVELDVGAERTAFRSTDDGYKKWLAFRDNQKRRDTWAIDGVAVYSPAIKRRSPTDKYIRENYPKKKSIGGTDAVNIADIVYTANTLVLAKWKYRADGKLYAEDNPFWNGTINLDPADFRYPEKKEDIVAMPSYVINPSGETNPDKSGNHDAKWSPSVALAFKKFHSRLYFRYAQTYRMPSIYETNYFPQAALINRDFMLAHGAHGALKPEKTRNFEVGLSHDFSRFFKANTLADVKLSYYNTNTKGVIDARMIGQWVYMDNLDKQIIKGLEFQSRFDNGKIFADFSANYNLEHKVCDAQMAYVYSPLWNRLPQCMDYGYPMGGLRNTRTPEYSVNLLLGTRLLNNKLEMGTRITHHSSYRPSTTNFDVFTKEYVGTPVHWNPVNIVDAFVNYKFAKYGTVEFSGTNLTNRYYVDPLIRTWMPAPGRTFRVGMKLEF